MAKSAIYTINTNAQPLAVGNAINLGSVQRRFGQNITLEGDSIRIQGAGYYRINADVTVAGTTAGTVGVALLKDGVELPGASGGITVASGATATIPLQALVREYGCCCNNNSTLTFVLTGTAETVNDINVIVEKL